MAVHCPFCGHPTGAAFDPCEHLLYIIVEGIFMELSTRFMNAAGLESYLDDRWEIPWGELVNRGGTDGIALGVRLLNHVQFALQTANDVIFVGFSDVIDEAENGNSQ